MYTRAASLAVRRRRIALPQSSVVGSTSVSAPCTTETPSNCRNYSAVSRSSNSSSSRFDACGNSWCSSNIASGQQLTNDNLRQYSRRPLTRQFHASRTVSDDEEKKEMSPKEKKKMLKEKAKAIQAEKDKEAEAAKPKEEEKKVDKPKKSKKTKPAETKKDDDKSVAPPKEDAAKPDTAAAATPSVGKAVSADQFAAAPKVVDGVTQYSFQELTDDAAKHKAGLLDETRPDWQNPLHHNNPDMDQMNREDFASQEAFEAAVVPAPGLAVDGSSSPPPPPHIKELANSMVGLSMLEYNELMNKLADHYGFSETTLSPAGGSDDGGDDDEDDDEDGGKAEEKVAFDVKLNAFDPKSKIKIIKEVRAIVAGLGLKEAKALVESAPVSIAKNINREDAEAMKVRLDAVGATTEVV